MNLNTRVSWLQMPSRCLLRDYEISANLHLKLYSVPGGVGDAEAEVLPVLGHQLLHHGGLARPAGPAQHQGPGRRRRGRAPDVILSYCHKGVKENSWNTIFGEGVY